MKVRFAPRALSEAERCGMWWQNNRPAAPDLFHNEVATAIEQTGADPALGALYPSAFGRTVRRVLIHRTHNHVYYVVRDDEVVVLSGCRNPAPTAGTARARGSRTPTGIPSDSRDFSAKTACALSFAK